MSTATLDRHRIGFQSVVGGRGSLVSQREDISRTQGFGTYREISRPIRIREGAFLSRGLAQLRPVEQGVTSSGAVLGLVAQLPFRYLRLLYNSELSEKFCHRLIELLTLRSGWDGEDAPSPKPEVLARMVGIVLLLKKEAAVFVEPFLAPTIEGYAQLEWHDQHRSLDIEATARGWAIVGSEAHGGGPRIYYEADAVAGEDYKLVEAYCWFAERRLTWPII